MIFVQIPLTAVLLRFSYSTIFIAQFIQLCHMTLLLARDGFAAGGWRHKLRQDGCVTRVTPRPAVYTQPKQLLICMGD